jgi:hypothetical protein
MLNNGMFDRLFHDLGHGTIEPLIHKGEWAVHEVLPFLLQRIGPADVKIATFSISEDSLRPLFFLVESEMIQHLTLLLDGTVKRHKLDMLLFALNITPSIRIDSNHAKILLVRSQTHSFGIVGSANLNQPKRIEAGFYFTAGKHFDFFQSEFEKYFNNAMPYELD